MSDTNDLREQMVRAIRDHVRPTILDTVDGIEEAATAALAIAEPAIRADERAKVIEELAQRAEQQFGGSHTTTGYGFADWLRAQADEPDERKIYIGFKQKDKEKEKDDK